MINLISKFIYLNENKASYFLKKFLKVKIIQKQFFTILFLKIKK